MGTPLATPDDVAELWRPLNGDAETIRISRLITKASALLRQRAPWVDARMAAFVANPADTSGLDPVLVAAVVASVVKRFLVNPDGATNTSETTGPYSLGKGFALRGDKDVRGELYVAQVDVDRLLAPTTKPRIGSIRVHAALDPWPFGRLGQPVRSIPQGWAEGDTQWPTGDVQWPDGDPVSSVP